MPDTSHDIINSEFKRLTNISFGARMKKLEKSLLSKTSIYNVIDLRDVDKKKKKKKKNLKR